MSAQVRNRSSQAMKESEESSKLEFYRPRKSPLEFSSRCVEREYAIGRRFFLFVCLGLYATRILFLGHPIVLALSLVEERW